MTETEWLASEDPAAMLKWLTFRDEPVAQRVDRTPRVSDRKLRLWACAMARQFWGRLSSEADRHAIEICEEFADDPSNRNHQRMIDAGHRDCKDSIAMACCFPEAASAASGVIHNTSPADVPGSQAALLRDIVGNPFRPVTVRPKPCVYGGRYCGQPTCSYCVANWPKLVVPGDEVNNDADAFRVADREARKRGMIFRDWLTPAVLSLARAAYDGDWSALGPLSDALEEAGCDDETLLRHLRDEEGPCPYRGALAHSLACHWCDGKTWRKMPGPHVRGCWAPDLILGKS